MCGRYVVETSPEELASYFDAEIAFDRAELRTPSYNVAPTTRVLGLALGPDGERRLGTYRWGLIPNWAKDPAVGNRAFNARAETLATKPSFRAAFKSRRIVVPADGYWEWRKGPGPLRQPFYLHPTDGEPLAFAGLSETWRDPRPGAQADAWVRSCTIITTAAGGALAAIHDRMPVILDKQVVELWLDPKSKRDELEGLLRPARAGTVAYYAVDRRVGDVRNDDRGLLERMELKEPTAGPVP